MLELAGLIKKTRGSGTFVCDLKIRHYRPLTPSWTRCRNYLFP
jgi:DNA-binding GntR family transcriptional regulator